MPGLRQGGHGPLRPHHALAARPGVPDELADKACELYESAVGEVAGDEWRPLLEQLEAVA